MIRKLVYGVGLNDADYKTRTLEGWICPYFRKWKDMLARCYSDYEQTRNPYYVGCYVCEEWLTFSNFKSWMETQDWKSKELDKDLLVKGNKVYSANTCIFITKALNIFITEKSSELPPGVSRHKDKFQARCSMLEGGQKYLGVYDNPEDAHKAWLVCKQEQANLLISKECDSKIIEALTARWQ